MELHNKKVLKIELNQAIKMSTDLNVGEIMLYNVDLDGSLNGMDLRVDKDIQLSKTNVPILIAGGLNNEKDAYEVLNIKQVSAVVIGTSFSLTKTTPLTIRKYCLSKGINMRNV